MQRSSSLGSSCHRKIVAPSTRLEEKIFLVQKAVLGCNQLSIAVIAETTDPTKKCGDK
jgi:hypothetical protein